MLMAGLLGVAIPSLWLFWPLPPFDYNLEASFNKSKLGMTREEVVALMGEPRRGGEQYSLGGDIWENSRTGGVPVFRCGRPVARRARRAETPEGLSFSKAIDDSARVVSVRNLRDRASKGSVAVDPSLALRVTII
jgi:hypothetical protein